MSTSLPPINQSDPGRGSLIMGLTWTFSSLACIIVYARLRVRIIVTKKLMVEDWLMMVAAVSRPLQHLFARNPRST
jgi:hypothetical protein